MSESIQGIEAQASPQKHVLRVAVFDLSRRALVGPRLEGPSLFIDEQPMNPLGLPGMPDEKRAVTLGQRVQLGLATPNCELPAMNALGRLAGATASEHGFAVAVRQPINYDSPATAVRPYDIDELFSFIQSEVTSQDSTRIDPVDARLLMNGILRIRELRRHVSSLQ